MVILDSTRGSLPRRSNCSKSEVLKYQKIKNVSCKEKTANTVLTKPNNRIKIRIVAQLKSVESRYVLFW